MPLSLSYYPCNPCIPSLIFRSQLRPSERFKRCFVYMVRPLYLVYPHYFHSPGLFCWWGEPILWGIVVLVVAGICARALCLTSRNSSFIASAIFAPFLVSLMATLFQIQMTFCFFGIHDEPTLGMIFFQRFVSYVGLFSSIALLLLWLGVRLFRRKPIVV